MDIKELRSRVDFLEGHRDMIASQIADEKKKLKKLLTEKDELNEAQQIIKAAAAATQDQLVYHVSDIGTVALAAVFDDPYELGIEFSPKRSGTEADIFFEKDGFRYDSPLDSTGGGAGDVAALSLRQAVWSLPKNRTRPIMILDEPLKNVNDPSRKLHSKAAEMLRMICDKLDMQVIIVTLASEIAETADKVFRVSKDGDKSVVEVEID